MTNDTILLSTGMKVLIENMGIIEAERFIGLVNREPFDYTKWRENLYEGMSVREISALAMEFRKKETMKNE